MITTTFKGGLGNQMFQYAIGRIIAEAKGHKLEINDPDNRRQQLLDTFPNAIGIDGDATKENTLNVAPDLQYLDLPAVRGHSGHVFLHGYWQKHYYYTPHKEKLKEWFTFDDSKYQKPDPDDLVLHVRLGDQLKPNPIGLPPSAETYVELLKQIPHKRCILVSDEPDEPFLAPVRHFPTVVTKIGKQMEDFAMIKHAKRVIISQSTFAWWASFLGDAETIWAPVTTDGRILWKSCPAVQDVDLVPLNGTYRKFKI